MFFDLKILSRKISKDNETFQPWSFGDTRIQSPFKVYEDQVAFLVREISEFGEYRKPSRKLIFMPTSGHDFMNCQNLADVSLTKSFVAV